MPAHDITALDACALSAAIHRRELSCREVMQACLARIDALNPRVNALVGLLPNEGLLAQADERDALLARGQSMGWMHGFPMAIKELSPVAGLPLSMGSPLLARQIAPHDSLMVARMKRSGGIVIGKSNVPEFGLGSHTYNPVFGTLAPYGADPKTHARLKPEAQWEYDQGQCLTGPQIYAASLNRTRFYRHMVDLFERFDLLVLPSAQAWPFPVEWTWPREVAGRTMDTYHRWMEVVIYATLAGLPAMSVPVGFGDTGLPMGMQLIGPPMGDLAVLNAAAAYEQTIGELLARRPPVD
jgi:Asp-tRNA(Asn)/Glu-tRNA(Gln) amidotransferase A subunit family amidase